MAYPLKINCLIDKSAYEEIKEFFNKSEDKIFDFFIEKVKNSDLEFDIGSFNVKGIIDNYGKNFTYEFRVFHNEEQVIYYGISRFSDKEECSFISGPNKTLVLKFLSQFYMHLSEMEYYE